jgi:thiamine-monophosphate kinase
MAVNISDIGAMGGIPTHALVSLGLDPETPVADVLDIYRGFAAELNPLGASIIGGNITKTDGFNFIDITLLGEAEKTRLVRRSTARPGDLILVTGFPGQAAAGLQLLLHPEPAAAGGADVLIRAYNVPTHRAREGRAVALADCATAMIDTSDGFLGDLGHLCTDSGVGAELFSEQLPLSRELEEGTRLLGKDPLDLILGNSDDYELIITCPSGGQEAIRHAIGEVSPLLVTEVGRVTDDSGTIHLVLPDGAQRPMDPSGWDHFSS